MVRFTFYDSSYTRGEVEEFARIVVSSVGMNFEKPSIALENINAALAEIESIRGEILQMGANDTEMNQIDFVIGKLKKGELTCLRAVEFVSLIKDSKSSYH